MNSPIREILAGSTKSYEWLEILGDCIKITENPQENRAVLEQMRNFEGEIKLNHMYDGPHRLPPDRMLNYMAAQTLAKADGIPFNHNDF